MKILDFFRKKGTEKVSDNETVIGILEREQEKKDEMNVISKVEKPFGEELPESARKTPVKSKKKSKIDPEIDTSIIDQLLDRPIIEIYKPYMEANKERCALQLKTSRSIKPVTAEIQHMYRTDIVYILIHNFNAYRRLFGYPIILWDAFEIFLLELLAREAHITEYSICINVENLVEEMEHGISGTIFDMFSSIRDSYFGTTDKVIMEVMNRLMQQTATIKTEYVIDEIQKLIDDPTIPNQYNDFMRYNDQLLCDMYRECMENGLITKMTFFTFIKNVYKCIIVDHIYRVDRKCVNPADKDGYEKKYKTAVTNACLQVNPVWFPNDEQTEEIIKLTYKILEDMNDFENKIGKTLKMTENMKPIDDNSVSDEWQPVEKSWDEFRNTGLVQITNQFLHIFGWALTYAKDGDDLRVFPARVRYRGFDVGSQTRAYEKLQKYMIENARSEERR